MAVVINELEVSAAEPAAPARPEPPPETPDLVTLAELAARIEERELRVTAY